MNGTFMIRLYCMAQLTVRWREIMWLGLTYSHGPFKPRDFTSQSLSVLNSYISSLVTWILRNVWGSERGSKKLEETVAGLRMEYTVWQWVWMASRNRAVPTETQQGNRDKQKPESAFFSKAPGENSAWPTPWFLLWHPEQRTQPHCARLLTYRQNCELVNRYCFKPLNLW